MAPGHSNGWGKALLDNIDQVATWGNNKKSRFLIISQQVDIDRNYVEHELKKNHKTNEIVFDIYEMKDPAGAVNDEDEFINKFKEFDPTVVILTYEHGIKGDDRNKLKQCPPRSVAAILKSKRHFSKILLINCDYLFMRTLNVWHREECILTSLTNINKKGVKEELENARMSGLLENSEGSRVLIISGGHGGPKKNKRVTPAGGVSCFTSKADLEYKFYAKDCNLVGIQPEIDICSYRQVNNESVVSSVNQTGTKLRPEQKQKLNSSGSLSKDSNFNKISFDVLNIAHFGIYDKPSIFSQMANYLLNRGSNTSIIHLDTYAFNIKKLIKYLEEYQPTFILIGWCFSSNGDLAMALRSQGFFSKLLLEHDLRNITKDPSAKLSDQQIEVLKQAVAMDHSGKKPKYKNFHLVGNSGCGKTILGMEIVKIILAQLCVDLRPGEKVNLCLMVQDSFTKSPKELKRKLEGDLSLNDLVSSYPVIKNDVQLRSFRSIQELSQKIKDALRKMPPAKCSVILVDEVYTNPEKVNNELVQSFTSIEKMEDNVRCVYAHSPVDWNATIHDDVLFKVELPLCPDVYSQHLHTRYRNNKDILQFLEFLTKERLQGHRSLVGDNDENGRRLPPKLDGSPYQPVLWLECNWSWNEMDQHLTREMVHSLVPTMDVFDSSHQKPVGVMILVVEMTSRERVAGQHWRWVKQEECAGLEEEIVVVVVVNSLSYEVMARARNQLIIVTGTDLQSMRREVLNKAKDENFLEKRIINDIPDVIEKSKERSRWPAIPNNAINK